MRILASTVSVFVFSFGCSYDYAGLRAGLPAGGGNMGVIGAGGNVEISKGSGGQAGTLATVSGGAAGPRGTGGVDGVAGFSGLAGAGGPTGGAAGITAATGGFGGSLAGNGGGIAAAGGAGASVGGSMAGGRAGTGGQGTGGAGGGSLITRILSVDFVGGRPVASGNGSVMSLPGMKPTDVAGVNQVARWNSALEPMGSLSGLLLSDGTVTAVTAAWNSPPDPLGAGTWWCGFADVPGDVRMMNGYLDPHSAIIPQAPATIVVTNLPATMTSNGYDVYVYVEGALPAGAVRTASYSIGASTFTVTATGPSPATLSGYQLVTQPAGTGNYLVFRNLTQPSFTLIATPGQNGRAPVNGMQIVSPAGL